MRVFDGFDEVNLIMMKSAPGVGNDSRVCVVRRNGSTRMALRTVGSMRMVVGRRRVCVSASTEDDAARTRCRGYVENLDSATLAELEALYADAKDAYFAGNPCVSDAYFDALELKLSYAQSSVVRKYPRCSVRGKAIYSDCVTDESQMRVLTASYLVILGLGILFVLIDLGHDLKAMIGSAEMAQAQFRPPVLALVGLGLSQRGAEKLREAREGGTLAMTGECPNCNEQVFAFMDTKRGQSKERCECHVCGRKIVFEATFERVQSSEWKVAGKGRVYLVANREDFSPEE